MGRGKRRGGMVHIFVNKVGNQPDKERKARGQSKRGLKWITQKGWKVFLLLSPSFICLICPQLKLQVIKLEDSEAKAGL